MTARCEHFIDRGNRFRPMKAVACPNRAVDAVDGVALCARHARVHRRLKEASNAALHALESAIASTPEK